MYYNLPWALTIQVSQIRADKVHSKLLADSDDVHDERDHCRQWCSDNVIEIHKVFKKKKRIIPSSPIHRLWKSYVT